MNLRIWTLVIMLVALSACAQPPTTKSIQNSTTDFKSRMDLNVHYEAIGEEANVSVYMGNPRGTKVLLWLVVNHSVPGERVNRETLIHEGTERTIHRIYRLPKGERDVNSILYVKVLNESGQETLRSKTVTVSTIGETL